MYVYIYIYVDRLNPIHTVYCKNTIAADALVLSEARVEACEVPKGVCPGVNK